MACVSERCLDSSSMDINREMNWVEEDRNVWGVCQTSPALGARDGYLFSNLDLKSRIIF